MSTQEWLCGDSEQMPAAPVIQAIDSGPLICAIIAIGMSIAFLVADHKSRTTRYLAAFLVCIGGSIYFNVTFVRAFPPEAMPWVSHLAPLLTSLSLIFGAQWILRIRRMVPAGSLRTRFGDLQFRLAQGFALIYAVVGVSLNEARAGMFIGAFQNLQGLRQVEFWYFATPLLFSLLCIIDGTLITLRRHPDRPEAVRLLGIALAAPLIASGLVLPAPWAAYGSAVGQMIFLIAAVQYHVLQGQRGQFLKRFLSPSVAELVRREGLGMAMQQQKLPIAVVACDLRGYTRFAQERDSGEVIAVLQQFYDEVGAAAAGHGATIKDYAGDGVLLLLGAPLPVAHHAQHAVKLAASIRQRCEQAFAQQGIELGIGVGVASGTVSVGVIGRERLEYVAVGQAINLAARLCQCAGPGEILVDEATLEQLEDRSHFVVGEKLRLKGFAEQVGTWQLAGV